MCLAGEGEGTEPGNSPQESYALHQSEPLITQQLPSNRNHMDCDFIPSMNKQFTADSKSQG